MKYLPEIYLKSWGSEEWVENSLEKNRCLKILKIDCGKKSSFHYHKEKDETFFLLKGQIYLHLSDDDNLDEAKVELIKVGECIHIPRGKRHRINALEESIILETSSFHSDGDTVRIHNEK